MIAYEFGHAVAMRGEEYLEMCGEIFTQQWREQRKAGKKFELIPILLTQERFTVLADKYIANPGVQ